MSSFKTPTQSQIDVAVQRMTSPDFEAYFFRRLENPQWIPPLKTHGFFTGPPSATTSETGETIFPHWPASNYLARMSKHAPGAVAEIFSEIKTDNTWVTIDLIEATLAMPAPIAATLVPAITHGLQGKQFIHVSRAVDVCVLLAEGEELSAALTLADWLFAPEVESQEHYYLSHDDHWKTDGIRKIIPHLVARAPRRFLRRMCEWLEIATGPHLGEVSDNGSDFSYMWRPSIDEHVENTDFDMASVLVGFIREGIEAAVGTDALSCQDVLDILTDFRYVIFRRIWIHVVMKFCITDVALVRSVLMDRDLFDDYQYIHEYAKFAEERFELLTREEEDTWFEWVDTGPSWTPDFTELDEKARVQACDDYRRNWQFKRFHWVRAYLKNGRRKLYEKMLAKHGVPELVDMNVGGGGVASSFGISSPMVIDDLAKLTFEGAVEKVSTWRLEEPAGFPAPDVEGLATTFGEYIRSNAEVFSMQADALIGRPAIYVRVFIGEMTNCLKDGQDISVLSVLGLCQWVVERPIQENTTPHDSSLGLVDKDWQWTRIQIAEFIECICKAQDDGHQRYSLEDVREPIWSLLILLCRDPTESSIVTESSEDDPRTESYHTSAMNSPRGKAIRAGFQYARWVANHIKISEDSHDVVLGGFEEIDEFREMLEWQIAEGNRSYEALAIIGLHIALIYWIDKDWLKERSDQLFRLRGIAESPRSAHGWAAWNMFLIWTEPHREFLNLFRDQFVYAVEESTRVNINETVRDQPMNRLGEHLMILYARGDLQLDDHLLGLFLEDTQPDIRRHAIGFIGRILQQDADLSNEILERLRILWEVYWSGNGIEDASQDPDSWLFGSWFSSGRFPASWSLDQLENFTTVVPLPQPIHAVAQRLVEITPTDVVRAARILDTMIRGDREGWHVYGWLDAAKQTLMFATEEGGPAREQAKRTIDYLGRRGHTNFGALLRVGS